MDKYESPHYQSLTKRLAEWSAKTDAAGAWPDESLKACGEEGVYRWFAEPEWGGWQWSEPDRLRGYLQIASGCLTTAFILTQRTGAVQRIALSDNESIKRQYLPGLTDGELFATVGISHLTTSRQHLGTPILTATPVSGGYALNGYIPWVSGAQHADVLVIGAELQQKKQLLLAIPKNTPGVSCLPPLRLVAVAGSHTSEVRFENVLVRESWVLAGPTEQVLSLKQGAGGAGGLQTSALALGLAQASIDALTAESEQRPELLPPLELLKADWLQQVERMLNAAAGAVTSAEEIRSSANHLALRSSQALLTACKGAGFLAEHCAGRYCREALFFLVWSCPRKVQQAHLCDFAETSLG